LTKTILTCAVTGNLTKPEMTPHLPITPAQIAEACLGAAEAGAAVVHIHVRHPESGKPSMELDHYAEVMQLIRAQNKQLVINLTTGPGGRFVPSEDEPKVFAAGTTLCHPLKRVEHITQLRPDICSLDLNTMNSGPDVVINTPGNARKMAKVIRDAGVMPELEIFDTGDLNLAKDMIADGSLQGPGLFTFVMGVKYGLNTDPRTLMFMRDQLPVGAQWAAFGIARSEFPIVAQAWLLGGHVRVGMEDNIYLEKGVLCESNAQLVSKARRIIQDLGGALASSLEARALLGLKPA
jgi:uncharacterized protein (DUF849 family)